jgi:hypothetical protein
MTTDVQISKMWIRGQNAYVIKYKTVKGQMWIIKNHYRQEVTIMEEFISDYLIELDKEGIAYEIT